MADCSKLLKWVFSQDACSEKRIENIHRSLKKNIVLNIPSAMMEFQRGQLCKRFLEEYAEFKAATSCYQHNKLEGDAKATFILTFSSDRTKIASTHGDHTVRIFDIRTGKLMKILRGHPRSPWCLSFHPIHNSIIASGCLSGELRIWDLQNDTNQPYNITNGMPIASLAFHPIDNFLAVASGSSLLFLDWKTGTVIHTFKTINNNQPIRLIRFDRLGNWMLTGIANNGDKSCEQFVIPEVRSSFQREGTTSRESNASCPVFSNHGSNKKARRLRAGAERSNNHKSDKEYNQRSNQLRDSASLSRPPTDHDNVTDIDDKGDLDASLSENSTHSSESYSTAGFDRPIEKISFRGSTYNDKNSAKGRTTNKIQSTTAVFSREGKSTTSSGHPSKELELQTTCFHSEKISKECQENTEETSSNFTENNPIRSSRSCNLPDSCTLNRVDSRTGKINAVMTQTDNSNSINMVQSQSAVQSVSDASIDTATAGSDTVTAGYNTATAGSNTATAGSHTVTAGSTTAAAGSDTVTEGSTTAAAGSDTATTKFNHPSTTQSTSSVSSEGAEEIPVHGFVSREEDSTQISDRRPAGQNDHRTVATATARTAGHINTVPRGNEDEAETAFRTIINRAIAGTFASNGDTTVASNIINTTYRLQYWSLSNGKLPDLTRTTASVIVPTCKLHNDGSVDMSEDGTLLAAFIPSFAGFPDNGMVRVFSLGKENFGQCIFSRAFGPNLISLSFSPLNAYLLVGLASCRLRITASTDQLVGQVLKLAKNEQRSVSESKAIFNVVHPRRQISDASVSVNTVKFHPTPGVGLIYGTSKGSIWHCKIGRQEANE